MEKRRLVKRLLQIANLKEKFARIRRAEAARAVSDQETHIADLESQQRADQEAVFQANESVEGRWIEAVEDARQVTQVRVENAEVELENRKETLQEEISQHIETIESKNTAEKVVDRVMTEWRDEQNQEERKELDDLGGVHSQRRKEE